MQVMPLGGLRLGQLVHAAGSLEHYQGRLQLSCKFLSPEIDPNAEPVFWLECAALRRHVYSSPLPTQPPAQRQCLERPAGGASCTRSVEGQSAAEALDAAVMRFASRRDSFRYADLLDDPATAAAARDLLRARGA